MTFESKNESAGARNENVLPFQLLSQSELVWWPYQTMSKSLLRTHHNAAALIEINRRLADEMRNIARREQDFVFELSEKILRRKADSESKSINMLPPETVDEIFETAISGIRQFGQAVAEAQVRSIEAFHRHARDAIGLKDQAPENRAQAAE
jgi:hypothetical protein